MILVEHADPLNEVRLRTQNGNRLFTLDVPERHNRDTLALRRCGSSPPRAWPTIRPSGCVPCRPYTRGESRGSKKLESFPSALAEFRTSAANRASPAEIRTCRLSRPLPPALLRG